MKRCVAGLVAVLLFVFVSGAIAETQMPSVKQQEKSYFTGLGFALKSLEEYVPVRLHVTAIQLKALQSGKEYQASFMAMLEFGSQSYPVKIIRPELDKFEADIMDPQAKGKEISTPVGHITLGVSKVTERKSIATGTLIIKTSDEKASGEFSLRMNKLDGGQDSPSGNGDGSASERQGNIAASSTSNATP